MIHNVDGSSKRVVSLDNDYDPDSQIDTTSVVISGPKFGDAISIHEPYNYDESPIPFDTITYSVSD